MRAEGTKGGVRVMSCFGRVTCPYTLALRQLHLPITVAACLHIAGDVSTKGSTWQFSSLARSDPISDDHLARSRSVVEPLHIFSMNATRIVARTEPRFLARGGLLGPEGQMTTQYSLPHHPGIQVIHSV